MLNKYIELKTKNAIKEIKIKQEENGTRSVQVAVRKFDVSTGEALEDEIIELSLGDLKNTYKSLKEQIKQIREIAKDIKETL